ncbi:MAG: FmdB family zinc ribbon protein [Nitrospirales bacterium]
MPIYEYQCESGEHRFEVQQKFSDPPLTTCTQCGLPVQKLISSPAIMFKGSGWYVTDYSNKLKPPTQANGNGKTDGTGASDEKAGDKGGEQKDSPSTASTSAASSSSGTSGPSTTGTSGVAGGDASKPTSSNKPAT